MARKRSRAAQLHLEAQTRYQKKMIALGFKGGRLPKGYIQALKTSNAWNKSHRLKMRAVDAKYNAKLRLKYGVLSDHTRYLHKLATREAKLAERRKQNAKLLHQLKTSPRIRAKTLLRKLVESSKRRNLVSSRRTFAHS